MRSPGIREYAPTPATQTQSALHEEFGSSFSELLSDVPHEDSTPPTGVVWWSSTGNGRWHSETAGQVDIAEIYDYGDGIVSTHEWGGTYAGFLTSLYNFASGWEQYDGNPPEGASENRWTFSIGWDGTHFDNWGQTFAFSGGGTWSGVNAAPSGETSYLSNMPGYDASLLGSYVPGVPAGWAPSAPPQHPPQILQIAAPPFVLGGGDEGGDGGDSNDPANQIQFEDPSAAWRQGFVDGLGTGLHFLTSH